MKTNQRKKSKSTPKVTRQQQKETSSVSDPQSTPNNKNVSSVDRENGDVDLCATCKCVVKKEEFGMQCEVCQAWFHSKCVNMKDELYLMMRDGDAQNFHWFCHTCNQSANDILQSLRDIQTRVVQNEATINAVHKKVELLEKQLKDQETAVKNSELNIDTIIKDRVEVTMKEFEDKERRKKNIVLFGIPEADISDIEEKKRNDAEQFKTVCNELGVPEIANNSVNIFRLGKTNPKNGSRPLKVLLSSESQKQQILSKSRNLINSQNHQLKKVSIKPDLTFKEREARKKLVIELKERQTKGEKDLIIRNGKIVVQPQQTESRAKDPIVVVGQQSQH